MENTEIQTFITHSGNGEEKKEAAQKRTRKGFRLTGIGSLILLGGCISTMLIPGSHPWYDYFLYIPTSVGACTVIYGFYCVFE